MGDNVEKLTIELQGNLSHFLAKMNRFITMECRPEYRAEYDKSHWWFTDDNLRFLRIRNDPNLAEDYREVWHVKGGFIDKSEGNGKTIHLTEASAEIIAYQYEPNIVTVDFIDGLNISRKWRRQLGGSKIKGDERIKKFTPIGPPFEALREKIITMIHEEIVYDTKSSRHYSYETEADRDELVRKYIDDKKNGKAKTQEAWASLHGIHDRTLRNYIKDFEKRNQNDS